MKLEDELRRALAREEPPGDFSGRVSDKIRAAGQRPGQTPSTGHRIIGLALAASLALGTGATLYYAHQRQLAEAERARVEQIRNDAVTGLRIASAKLNDVYEKLQRISSQNERTR